MSDIDRPVSAGVAVRSIVGFLSAPRDRRQAERRLLRATVRELGMLSNRELAEIGLARRDVQRVADEAVARVSRSWLKTTRVTQN